MDHGLVLWSNRAIEILSNVVYYGHTFRANTPFAHGCPRLLLLLRPGSEAKSRTWPVVTTCTYLSEESCRWSPTVPTDNLRHYMTPSRFFIIFVSIVDLGPYKDHPVVSMLSTREELKSALEAYCSYIAANNRRALEAFIPVTA
jgi:hypothetical protein